MDQRGRLGVLDSMRAIAALGVVCWHFRAYFWVEPLKLILEPFYRNGLVMVDFFFVLSGFVLARAYWNDERRHDVIGNLRQRIARLYPLHLVMLILVVAIQWATPSNNHIRIGPFHNNDAHNFVLHLMLLQASGLQHAGTSFNEPSWSISTEFLVNIAFLLIITLPRNIAVLSAGLMAATLIAPMSHIGIFSTETLFGFLNGTLARTCIEFFIGTMTYLSYARYLENRVDKYPATANVLFAALCVFLGHRFYTHTMTGYHGDIAVLLIGFPSLIVLTLRSMWAHNFLALRPLIFLGERSYSIYLVHFPVLLVGMGALDHFKPAIDMSNPLILISVLSIIVGIASLTYRYIEVPGKWLLSSRKGIPVAASPTTESPA